MGGGGSIQNMINTLKNNRALLKNKRKGAFNVERFRAIERAYPRSAAPAPVKKTPFSEEDRQQLRQRLRADYRRTSIQKLLVTLLAACLVFFGAYRIYQEQERKNLEKKKLALEAAAREKQRAFNYQRQLADAHWKRQDYHQASFHYIQALETGPDANLEPLLVHALGLAFRQNPSKEALYRRELSQLIERSSQKENLQRLKAEYFD